MSRADVKNSNKAAMLSLKGRVDFMSLLCCKLDSLFAVSFGHEFFDPSFESVLWKLEYLRNAFVVSVCDTKTPDDST